MATPAAMIRWLESKRPNEVVAECICDTTKCVIAHFFREHGVKDKVPGIVSTLWPWFSIGRFPLRDITASQALSALRESRGR